ncbi:MAG: hypothetical protein WBO55_05835 [Rhizobiaceae bacterium]
MNANPQHPQSDANQPDPADIQANIIRGSRHVDGSTRNWGLYVFFRILSRRDIAAARRFLLGEDALAQDETDTLAALQNQSEPSAEFLAWLKLVTTGEGSLLDALASFYGTSGKGEKIDLGALLQMAKAMRGRDIDALLQQLGESHASADVMSALLARVRSILGRVAKDARLRAVVESLLNLTAFGSDATSAGKYVLSKGLLPLVAYEILRQARSRSVRSERQAHDERIADTGNAYDTVPVNFAFNQPGLEALRLDPETLRSFPDAFRDGMAARAEHLGDTGGSAPQNWDGRLGLRSIHGYFTGGFLAGSADDPVDEAVWKALRANVREFNDGSNARANAMRTLLKALFLPLGMEIEHIELGQDPYRVADGKASPIMPRVEHFGFRDGLSQPFLDLKLGAPPPGGGRPGGAGVWSPVAPGEILLGHPDEDGKTHLQPANASLRDNGTFIVFRKLQQNVAALQSFLRKERGDDVLAREKLAARMMGRWKNGTSLVRYPDYPGKLGADGERRINDFLYAAEDPGGLKCPLGSHARRSNPRDSGGRDEVRRHRLLRRSIAYGGSLIEDEHEDDGEPRGILFIALCSRIDVQFEVVQAEWINGGEFLGQAGLARCPITGNNGGSVQDSFLEPGAIAPVVRLPAFVETRGGDYFFAPSLSALTGIATGQKFPLDQGAARPISDGFVLGDVATDALFDPGRIRGYVGEIVSGKARTIRMKLPPMGRQPDGYRGIESPVAGTDMVFAGRHGDVVRILSQMDGEGDARHLAFSIRHYQDSGKRLLRGHNMLIGTEPNSDTQKRRQRLQQLLRKGWEMLGTREAVEARVDAVATEALDIAMRRILQANSVDLVREFATQATYRVVSEVLGTPGPDWLTELAVALPFARQHATQVYPDWLAACRRSMPPNPGLVTMQVWSVLSLADVFGNVVSRMDLAALAAQAGSEFVTHISQLLAQAAMTPRTSVNNLLEAFVAIAPQFIATQQDPDYGLDAYRSDVTVLLLELIASAMAAVPGTFGNVCETVLDAGLDLNALFRLAGGNPVAPGGGYSLASRVIYEAERLKPNFAILMRHCVADAMIGDEQLKKGDWIASLIPAANLDPRVFDQPWIFSLHPFQKGPARRQEDYLLFGSVASGRHCWGRDAMALRILERCLLATSRLRGLRRFAGKAGEPAELVRSTVGLRARFSSVDLQLKI